MLIKSLVVGLFIIQLPEMIYSVTPYCDEVTDELSNDLPRDRCPKTYRRKTCGMLILQFGECVHLIELFSVPLIGVACKPLFSAACERFFENLPEEEAKQATRVLIDVRYTGTWIIPQVRVRIHCMLRIIS
jgi:hypothetical protein